MDKALAQGGRVGQEAKVDQAVTPGLLVPVALEELVAPVAWRNHRRRIAVYRVLMDLMSRPAVNATLLVREADHFIGLGCFLL